MPLKKSLGFFSVLMYGVGLILGAGVYALIGQASLAAGNAVWMSFIIGAGIASFTGLSYAELSSAYHSTSAESSYLQHAFKNDWLAFIIGWLVTMLGLITASTVALGFAGYFAAFFAFPIIWIAVGLIIFLGVINFIGIDISAKLNILFTLIEALGIILIIYLGIPFLGTVDYFEISTGFSGIINAAALVFFAYVGFEAIAKLGEETKNPEKVLPKALIASIIITSILYILLAMTVVSVVPFEVLGTSNAPLALVAETAAGSGMGLTLAIIALFATLNTVLISMIVTSRMLYGLGKKHDLPHYLTKIHPVTKSPWVAVIFTTVGAALLVFLGDIEIVAKATTFTTFITFIAVNFALIKLRHNPKYKPKFKLPFNIGKFPIIPALGVLTSGAMLFAYGALEVLITLAFIAVGLFFYYSSDGKRLHRPFA